MMWGNFGAFIDTRFVIIGNKFLHLSDYFSSIARADPWTGKTLWEIEAGVTTSAYSVTSNYLFVVLEKAKTLYRIHPGDGKVDSLNLTQKDVISMASMGESVWLLSSDGHLTKVDGDTLKELHSFDVGKFEEVRAIGNKLLLSNVEQERLIVAQLKGVWNGKQKNFKLFDPQSGDARELKTNSAKVINGSLITQDDNLIQCLNPDKLEPLWWLNTKDIVGTNPHVA